MSGKYPEVLYHYTTQTGLLGILSTQKIWATQINYLNDTKEFWHALEIAEKSLAARVQTTSESTQRQSLKTMQEGLESLANTEIFISSFSEGQDSLGQWRGYVGNQPGFAIGFNFKRLRQIAYDLGAVLEPCIYGPGDQAALIAGFIEGAVVGSIRGISGFLHPEHRTLTVLGNGEFSEKLTEVAPLMKDQAFQEEREWRIVYKPGAHRIPVKYRPGNSMLLPFVELPLLHNGFLSCIEEIIVGPCAHLKPAESALQGLLRVTKVLKPVPRIVISRAPFRYW